MEEEEEEEEEEKDYFWLHYPLMVLQIAQPLI